MQTREPRRAGEPRPQRAHDAPPVSDGVAGIVLAGVHAWGDSAFERVTCRPLVPVATRPLVGHALAWLRRGGVAHAVVCANSDTAALHRALGAGDAYGMSLQYYEDVMPRGPAGCARDAALTGDADTLVVVDGTVIPGIDLRRVLAQHVASTVPLTVVAYRSESVCGGRDGEEQPTGIYVFDRSALIHVPDSGYHDIKENLIPALYRRGKRVGTYRVSDGAVARVTDAASYLSVNMWAVQDALANGSLPVAYRPVGDAYVHASARVDASVRFVGPVLVEAACVIEPGAWLVGPTSLGVGCRVGAGAMVSRTALWRGCRIGAGAIIDKCVFVDGTEAASDAAMRETVCIARRRAKRKWRRPGAPARTPVDGYRPSGADAGGVTSDQPDRAASATAGDGTTGAPGDVTPGGPDGVVPDAAAGVATQRPM
ncbi:MAG: sugar phosphate nucleotidyltransferase [Phycisphaerae bacterium]